MKYLLTLIFLLMSQYAMCSDIYTFKKTELENSSDAKLNAIYNEHLKFIIKEERDRNYDNFEDKNEKFSFLNLNYFNILISEAIASTKAPKSCIPGGYPSTIETNSSTNKNICKHPTKNPRNNYKSCKDGGFRCNPAIFKEGTCIKGPWKNDNLSRKCLDKGKLKDPVDLQNALSSDAFKNYQNKIKEYCNDNAFRDNCVELSKALYKIKKAKDSFPSILNTVKATIDAFDFTNFPKIRIDCTQIDYCSDKLTQPLEETYETQYFSAFLGDALFEDPRTTCEPEANNIQNIDISKLNNQLKKENPALGELDIIPQACRSKRDESIPEELRDKDKDLAKAYMMTDFVVKNKVINDAQSDLLESDYQLSNLLGNSGHFPCSKLKNSTVIQKCRELNHCKRPQSESSKSLFNVKKEELQHSLALIKDLSEIKNEFRPLAQKKKEKEEKDAAIEKIIKNNPMLSSDRFADIVDDVRDGETVSDKELSKTLSSQIKFTRKIITNKILKLSGARDCLSGKSSSCDDYDEIMIQAKKSTKPRNAKSQDKEIKDAYSYHSCIEKQKDEKYSVFSLTNDPDEMLSQSFNPFGANKAIEKKSEPTAEIKKQYNKNKGYKACSAEKKKVEKFSQSKKLSCSDRNASFISASIVSRCSEQLIAHPLLHPKNIDSWSKNIPSSFNLSEVKSSHETEIEKSLKNLALEKIAEQALEKIELNKKVVTRISPSKQALTSKSLILTNATIVPVEDVAVATVDINDTSNITVETAPTPLSDTSSNKVENAAEPTPQKRIKIIVKKAKVVIDESTIEVTATLKDKEKQNGGKFHWTCKTIKNKTCNSLDEVTGSPINFTLDIDKPYYVTVSYKQGGKTLATKNVRIQKKLCTNGYCAPVEEDRSALEKWYMSFPPKFAPNPPMPIQLAPEPRMYMSAPIY